MPAWKPRPSVLSFSPQDGFYRNSQFPPGDIVKKGELLGTLDNKDLTLEYQRWSSELGQLQTEYREALARHDRASVSILQARIAQTEAQMSLVREQLLRSQFTAPFDGLVVSGDLSQALGSPVERGQVLFTVAPLDVYRIILQIDERDIGEIKRGSTVVSFFPVCRENRLNLRYIKSRRFRLLRRDEPFFRLRRYKRRLRSASPPHGGCWQDQH